MAAAVSTFTALTPSFLEALPFPILYLFLFFLYCTARFLGWYLLERQECADAASKSVEENFNSAQAAKKGVGPCSCQNSRSSYLAEERRRFCCF
jgi:hypothetical protein